MRHFDYEKVDSLKEAFDAVSASKGGSVFMAGGTDLLVQIKEGKIQPKRVIDVKGIHEMDGLSVPGDELLHWLFDNDPDTGNVSDNPREGALAGPGRGQAGFRSSQEPGNDWRKPLQCFTFR